MSKKSNVHPDHYKTAGRSRLGDDLLQKERPRSMRSLSRTHQARSRRCSKGATKGEATRAIESAEKPVITKQTSLRGVVTNEKSPALRGGSSNVEGSGFQSRHWSSLT